MNKRHYSSHVRPFLVLLFALLLLALIGCAGTVSFAETPLDADLRVRMADASRVLHVSRTGLQRAVDFARSRPDLFNREKNKAQDLLTRQDKLVIWSTWSSVLDSLAALDAIRGVWKDYSLLQEKARRNVTFALNQASFLAAYRYALEFIGLSDRNSSLNVILDEAVPELGITAGNFSRFKFRFLNGAVATEFSALQVIGASYGRKGVPQALRLAIDEDSAFIWNMGKGKGHVLTFKNALAVVQKAAFTAWFPVQKNVSEWMGDTKVHRVGTHLISGEQIVSMRERLQPGDILFERHEWYLSNMGLPGFWTHAALYVGTPGERRAFFVDPETTAWVKGQGIADGDLESLLKQRYPKAYAAGTTAVENGHAPRVLEAISEGVSFTSLEQSGASDSIAVLRPRLAKREKAQTLVRAFHYSGRPYDFNFDFETDASLVCSELVYKTYEPAAETKGLRFPLDEIMGRKVSTPNGMVRQFDEQHGSAEAQTDLVLFLDGFEKEKRAVESTLEQFRASWRRPNWHILIQQAPEELAAGH